MKRCYVYARLRSKEREGELDNSDDVWCSDCEVNQRLDCDSFALQCRLSDQYDLEWL